MQYIAEVELKSLKSNFEIADCRIENWRFFWKNDMIRAFTRLAPLKKGDIGSCFEALQAPRKIGLLVDLLSFSTDLTISAAINYKLYESNEKVKRLFKDEGQKLSGLIDEIKKLRLKEKGISDEWPLRIRPGFSTSFSNSKKEIIKYILKSLSVKKFKINEIKLLNYWRRGFDLDNLGYCDESFLAFFKVLEYFEKRYYNCRSRKDIPKIYKGKKNKRRGFRMAVGGGIFNPKADFIKLLGEFIDTRNHIDIAHMRIKPLPTEREGALYFTYLPELWDLHDHIKEVSKFFILKFLGVQGLTLRVEGGLFCLKMS